MTEQLDALPCLVCVYVFLSLCVCNEECMTEQLDALPCLVCVCVFVYVCVCVQ
jgi:hypothetical protein